MITVLRDDLAFLAVDAVFRPADQHLDPAGAAMRRLDAQAGPRFARLRRVNSELEVGAAVVTGGGELAAPFVVHVVVQDAEPWRGMPGVRRALVSAWQRCAEWGFRRVAAPLVGTGPGQLGLEEATRLLVETFPGGAGGTAAELAIVVEREEERELVEAVVRRGRA